MTDSQYTASAGVDTEFDNQEPRSADWLDANQAALIAALNRIRSLLQGDAIAAQPTNPPGLERIRATFGLSPFECDLLLLCAGIELDAHFSQLCAELQGSGGRGFATFGLAFGVLPGGHWSAVAPGAPLRYWRLLELDAGATLATSPLRIDERVLHYLTGLDGLDTRLAGSMTPGAPVTPLAPGHERIVEAILAAWSQRLSGSELPMVQLCGRHSEDAFAIVAATAGALGCPQYTVSALDLPANAHDMEEFVRLWTREAALSGAILLLDATGSVAADGQHHHIIQKFLQSLHCPVVVWVREPLTGVRRPSLDLVVEQPSHAEQVALWQAALGPAAAPLNGAVERLAAQFSLSAQAIGQVAWQHRADDPVNPTALWDACRIRVRGQLDELAQRIEPLATWEDLIIPEGQRQQLHAIAAHVRRQTQVFETWGFAHKHNRGLGVSALFAGASGTGKTMAAEVIANELRLDLYRIDLSQVVSKYIGETEKNLRRVFDAAEDSGAILLFDEADALFGKRSEVRDSHDRYANIEVSYLLQRMEAYRGLAILTTNLKHALDPAFLRRLRFVVNFPFPDTAQRAQIWRNIFPAEAPTAGIQIERLAQLNVAGGHIRNVALHAAFLAADAAEPVRMAHVLAAARMEYAKLEKPLSEIERLGEP